MMTLSSGLATLRGQFTTNFPVLMAGSLLAMLPMVILYLIFQRQFIIRQIAAPSAPENRGVFRRCLKNGNVSNGEKFFRQTKPI